MFFYAPTKKIPYSLCQTTAVGKLKLVKKEAKPSQVA
jgi:hypothetical protein